MESFLEEEIAIGAEVEIGAPADDSVALRPKRKSKILKKVGLAIVWRIMMTTKLARIVSWMSCDFVDSFC